MRADNIRPQPKGPIAQHFYAAFCLGDKYVAQRVALASIQALCRVLRDKDEEIRRLVQEKGEQIRAVQKQLQAFEERISRINSKQTGSKYMRNQVHHQLYSVDASAHGTGRTRARRCASTMISPV